MRIFLVLVLMITAVLGAALASPQVDATCLAQRALHLGDDDRDRWSCLHYAAARGDVRAVGRLAAVRTLLRHGAEVDVYDTQSGFTPLHLAAEGNHAAVVRRLLAASASVDARNQWDQTPLWQTAWQAWHGNTEVAHILVARGARIDVTDDKGHTPLHMAARAGHTPMVAFLLDAGADLEHRSDKGLTPLYQAVTGGHPDTVRLLLERGADPEVRADGVSALELARREHRDTITGLLLAHMQSGDRGT
jgi:ankyrin